MCPEHEKYDMRLTLYSCNTRRDGMNKIERKRYLYRKLRYKLCLMNREEKYRLIKITTYRWSVKGIKPVNGDGKNSRVKFAFFV